MSVAIQPLVLDLDGPIVEAEIVAHFPQGRVQKPPLLLTSFGVSRITRSNMARDPIHWDGVAQGVRRMAERAKASDDGFEFWVVGKAPLPVFTLLGFELSKWTKSPVFLNRRPDERWDRLETATASSGEATFFNVRTSLAVESETTGTVAVFISTQGVPGQRAEIRRFVTSRGDDLGAIVELRTAGPGIVTAESVPSIVKEVNAFFSQLPGAFPHATKWAVFVAGPASLAFIVGRGMNPTMMANVSVPNFHAGTYSDALVLPWRGASPPGLTEGAEHEVGRSRVLDCLIAGIKGVRDAIRFEDLPRALPKDLSTSFLANLEKVSLPTVAEGDVFELNILQARLAIGRGLLEGLRGLDDSTLRIIGAELFLHEVWHFEQNVLSTNYRQVGRAGVVLEEIDFQADAVAITAASKLAVRLGKPLPASLVLHIEAHIRCMEAFDRSEQGSTLVNLPERRLRRYLIWHLELARARTITDATQIDELLGQRLVVELAPIRGFLNAVHDKLAGDAAEESELFISLAGNLHRYQKGPNLTPCALVRAVRDFDWQALENAMKYVIGEDPAAFVSWHNRGPAGPLSQ